MITSVLYMQLRKILGFFFSFIKFLLILWAIHFEFLLGFVAGNTLLKAAK